MGDAWRLFNLAYAPEFPPEQRVSRRFRSKSELIDHIFVSHALIGLLDSVTTVAPAALPSITETATARKNATTSDDAMVLARIQL
jgi:hypothetical protein